MCLPLSLLGQAFFEPVKHCQILLLLLFCQGLGLQAQQSFRQQHAAAYQQALAYLEANKALIRQELPAKQAAAILAIGFPEMVRYHLFRDFIETKILEALYTRYGSTYADFSVGIFQMKPSFVEALEDLVRNHKLAQKHPIFPLAQEASAQRQERLARLQDFGWQLRYLYAFYEVAQKHFGQTEIAFFGQCLQFGLTCLGGRSASLAKGSRLSGGARKRANRFCVWANRRRIL